MTNLTPVAEFLFVANKSFAGDAHPITVPARCNVCFKEYGLVESAPAKIIFRKEPAIEGSIRVGWRAGGKYYQIAMSKPQAAGKVVVNIGTKLMVRVLKTPQEWLIEII